MSVSCDGRAAAAALGRPAPGRGDGGGLSPRHWRGLPETPPPRPFPGTAASRFEVELGLRDECVSREPQRVFSDSPQCILGFTLRLEEPPNDGQRRPSRRNSARTFAPSLMLRTASAKLSLPTPGEAEAVIAAGISATVASRRKSGMPRRRARMDACTSAPSDNRLRRSAAAVNATGDDASWPQAESRFTRSSPSGAGVMRWRRFPP
jgi:hypothetical protein